jgi:hypothetical protein
MNGDPYVVKEKGKKSSEWINIGFFTLKEENEPLLALDRTAKAIVNLTSNGLMNLYTDLFIVPQKTQTMSGDSIMGEVYHRYDVLYGRPTYYLNTVGNPLIVAVGDPIYYNNKTEIILGIAPNIEYQGNLPQGGHTFPTRDVEGWQLHYEKNFAESIDNTLLNTATINNDAIIDEQLKTLPSSTDSLDGMDFLSVDDVDMYEEDEEEKRTRQLVNEIIVLDVSDITASLIHLTEESANQRLNGFYKELIPLALNHHIITYTAGSHTIHDGTYEYLEDQVKRLAVKWNIDPETIPLKLYSQTSQMGAQYVKYNWRTVQQTQGTQTYSLFLCMHRKAHHTTLTYRENIYTAATRSQCRIFGVMSKALLDGSLPKGGVNAQRYPGNTVVEKVSRYVKKNRTISQDELIFDETLEQLVAINAERNTFNRKRKAEEDADWYEALEEQSDRLQGVIDELPF